MPVNYFFDRSFLIERLRLNLRQSYRLIRPSRNGLVSSDEIVRLLNRSRRGIDEPYTFVPSDIMTADEIISMPELAQSGITLRKLRAWSRRTRNIVPHFRLNSHTIRYPMGLFVGWLAKNSKVERRS